MSVILDWIEPPFLDSPLVPASPCLEVLFPKPQGPPLSAVCSNWINLPHPTSTFALPHCQPPNLTGVRAWQGFFPVLCDRVERPGRLWSQQHDGERQTQVKWRGRECTDFGCTDLHGAHMREGEKVEGKCKTKRKRRGHGGLVCSQICSASWSMAMDPVYIPSGFSYTAVPSLVFTKSSTYKTFSDWQFTW